jgi:hypothetical protein
MPSASASRRSLPFTTGARTHRLRRFRAASALPTLSASAPLDPRRYGETSPELVAPIAPTSVGGPRLPTFLGGNLATRVTGEALRAVRTIGV